MVIRVEQFKLLSADQQRGPFEVRLSDLAYICLGGQSGGQKFRSSHLQSLSGEGLIKNSLSELEEAARHTGTESHSVLEEKV